MPDDSVGSFQERMSLRIGRITGILEGVNSTVENIKGNQGKQAESIAKLRSDMATLKDEILKQIVDIKVDAAREGGKNGTKWAVVIGSITIFISLLLPIIVKAII